MPFLLNGFNSSAESGKERVCFLLMTGFFITLYLPGMPVLNNIFIGLLIAVSFILNTVQEKLDLLKRRPTVQWMFVFFALHLISFFFSQNQQQAANVLQMRVTLLLFPISLGLIEIEPSQKNRLIRVFSAVTVLAAFVCLLIAVVGFYKTGDASLLYNDSLSYPLRMQSVYFALLINLAIVNLLWLQYQQKSKRNRTVIYAAVLLLLIVHFMLASRIGLIILYTSFLAGAVYFIIRRKKFLLGTILVTGLLSALLLMIAFLPKTINRFRELMYTDYQYESRAAESHFNMKVTREQWNGANIRLAIWKCGWELSRGHLLSGAQIGDKQDKLQEIYKAKKFSLAYENKRNMHNTYLDVLSTFGIPGLLVFLAAYLITPFIYCVRYRDITGIFTILAIGVSMFTEAYLDRSLGALILAFFITFVTSDKREPAFKRETV